jgi:hypothetical protein
MKAWLKGGLIAVILITVIFLISITTSIDLFDQLTLFLFVTPLLPLILLFAVIFGNPIIVTGQDFAPFPNIIGFIILYIEYFIIGALIGLLISKLKQKNQKTNTNSKI